MTNELVIPTCGRNNCGGRCLLYAHVSDGKIIKMTTDTSPGTPTDPPLTACARGLNYHKTFLGKDRLQTPLRRVGARGEGKFVPISWTEAIDLLAQEWIRIRDTYGPASRYVHYSWGISALVRPNALIKRLLALDGGYLDYEGSYSTGCIRYTTPYLYGTNDTGSSLHDLLNSSVILLWGHNPKETQFDHTMYFLQQAKEKGIPIYCIDPRKSDTVKSLDATWIPLRPTTDAALADAMAYVIITENRYDNNFIHRCCIGFTADTMPAGSNPQDNYFDYVLGTYDGIPKTPIWAESITGTPAQTIIQLARAYANGKPAALLTGYGPQRHANGEQTVRGTIMLACLTGNVGLSGGGAAGTGYYAAHATPKLPSIQNPVTACIPFFLWTKAIEHPEEFNADLNLKGADHLDTGIKMLFNLGGNALINQHSDINRTAAILQDTNKCEFIVCSDLFMTSSVKFADLVLPSISFLEMDNITTPWEYGNFIGFNNKVVEPLYDGKFEYDWLKEIAKKLGLYEPFTAGHETVEDWLRDCYQDLQQKEPDLPPYETLKREGVYRYPHSKTIIAFEQQRMDVEKTPFPTPSGKVEIYSPALAALHREGVPVIPKYVPAKEGPGSSLQEIYPLQLIGWHTKRRCHSIHDNNRAMDKLDPQTLRMHPKDAADRNIADGDLVLIFNDRGKIQIPVTLTEDIMEGCVALSQGAWYTPNQQGVDTRGSINVLTSQEPTPLARANPQHTNLVEVQRVK
ncbi:MAG: DMSO/selenate family reductase complex A subunit [Lachnospiraceae bacterium]